MGTGAKRHLKRVAAPKSWVLNKLGGVFAPKLSSGPHKFRKSPPLILFLRNKAKICSQWIRSEENIKPKARSC